MKNNNNPVAFFDSGVGGLSIYSRFRKLLPNENTVYFGDLKHLPYGNKSVEELYGYATNILEFFKTLNVKAVVIACNTISCAVYDLFKNDYDFKIYPIAQTVAKNISETNSGRIGVFATDTTIKYKKYTQEIQRYNPNIVVEEISAQKWVEIVEGFLAEPQITEEINKPMKLMREFNPYKIILGCTHFPFLMERLTEYFPPEMFIDPAEIFVECVKQDFVKNNLLNNSPKAGTEKFYVSANPQNFMKNSTLFYKVNTPPDII